MSAPEENVASRGPLVATPATIGGWGRDGLVLSEVQELCAVLVTLGRGRGGDLTAEDLARLGAGVSPDRGVHARHEVSVVSCGRGRFLATRCGDAQGELLSLLKKSLAGGAAIVDYSDQLVCLELRGSNAARVLSMLCSIDFDDLVFPAGTAVVARMHEVRAYIWREQDLSAFVVGVPRSFASGVRHSMVEACQTICNGFTS